MTAAVFLILAVLGSTLQAQLPPREPTSPAPEFSFGLIADVQYADKESAGARQYRAALVRLRQSLADLNRLPLAFLANLGDSIDGRGDQSMADLRLVLEAFTEVRSPVLHLVGNHCLEVPRAELLPSLGLTNAYYSVHVRGWQVIVLDTMDVSLKAEPDTEERQAADAWLAREPDLADYNGAVGSKQLRWLREELVRARESRFKVIVLSHHPLATVPDHAWLLAWNAPAVRQVLAESGCVVACFSGHDHEGAYTSVDGIHYLSLPGMVEAPSDGNRYAVVDVYGDRLELRGRGDVAHRELRFPSTPHEP